ncbi:RanBP2-type domain-containing protein [Pleurotus pulmonarius]
MTSPEPLRTKTPDFEHLVSRLKHLDPLILPHHRASDDAPPRTPDNNPTTAMAIGDSHTRVYPTPPRSPRACTLDPAFSYYPHTLKERRSRVDENGEGVIGSFAPRTSTLESSPSASSTSATSSSPTPTSMSASVVSSASATSLSSANASEFDPVASRLAAFNLARSTFEAFVASQSRVVRLYDLPPSAERFLSAVFAPQHQTYSRDQRHCSSGAIPTPVSMWTLRSGALGDRPESVWAVFGSHEEARAALSLSGSSVMSVAPALERDLEPFHQLQRFVLHTEDATENHDSIGGMGYSSGIAGGMGGADYQISSNPPNPRTSFRLGDWICPSSKCAAHNFGRNILCIGCGTSRVGATNEALSSTTLYQTMGGPQSHSTRPAPSPRFSSFPSSPVTATSTNSMSTLNAYGNMAALNTSSLSAHSPAYTPNMLSPSPCSSASSPATPSSASTSFGFLPQLSSAQQHSFAPQSKSSHQQRPQHSPSQFPQQNQYAHANQHTSPHPHPLLTPSGRAFARGGRVQNISSDPMLPCIMWWPDNEPLPEQGQIRPPGLASAAHPPILNTGNKGPIAHQPGDWICKKCNYLNWRRRKVCQTCLPYAEGNGDSISAAVQAERIALLTSVLATTQLDDPSVCPSPNPALSTAFDLKASPQWLPLPPSLSRQSTSPTSASSTPLFSPSTTLTFGGARSQTMTPSAYEQQLLLDAPGHNQLRARGPVHRSRSFLELSTQRQQTQPLDRPIYQTGGAGARVASQNVQYQSQLSSPASQYYAQLQVQSPAPILLPSFLQNMVHSPVQSPTSTSSSVELALDDDADARNVTVFGRGRNPSAESSGTMMSSSSASSTSSPTSSSSSSPSHLSVKNIWQLDGEESKSLSPFALSHHAKLASSRKSSLEHIHS